VWDKSQLEAINPANTSHLLGLFERSHMKYEVDRATDTGGEPSLSEMTSKAIDILAKNPQGFFLMVEGGRIDHAHHAGDAYRALNETIEFSRAVKVALEKTDAQKTLIIVTADHSHVLTIAGYPKRGNSILGKVIYPGQTEPAKDLLGLPYTTLSYANGPGYTGASDKQPQGPKSFPHEPSASTGITAGRPDLTTVDTTAPNYLQEAPVPLGAETHGGEDVVIYATGPGAYLVHGVQEQNVIFHIIKDSLF